MRNGSPGRGAFEKIYRITEAGRATLLEWVRSAPEPMDVRKAFLIQLSWADVLTDAQLDALLAAYEEEIHTQLSLHLEKARRGLQSPNRTRRETLTDFTDQYKTYMRYFPCHNRREKLPRSSICPGMEY